MDEENWIETTKMRKSLKKVMKKIVKYKKIAGLEMQETIIIEEEWNFKTITVIKVNNRWRNHNNKTTKISELNKKSSSCTNYK